MITDLKKPKCNRIRRSPNDLKTMNGINREIVPDEEEPANLCNYRSARVD